MSRTIHNRARAKAFRPRMSTAELLLPKKRDLPAAVSQLSAERAAARESSVAIRRQVFARDEGLCSSCGINTEALYDEWMAAIKADAILWDCNICGRITGSVPCIHCGASTCSRSFENRSTFRKKLETIGVPAAVARGYNGATLWNADHCLSVNDVGAGLGLDNLRTLCLRCHGEVTAFQAETRAMRRRAR